ncbi:MAG TPA: NAD(P)-dependent oxidoreductase [Gemmataceae bacterium]|jgi:nucleoside-diphosphate-sugar epimerase|nr:NAD(P)-dependent oxidoreductase [Gemmataceae bacterium]
MTVTVIGARGFVGSAFVSHLASIQGVEVMSVTRDNYADLRGRSSDIVIEASCNSKKYLADERPVEEFELSVVHRQRTLIDFPAGLHVHVSSVDVYSDLSSLEGTHEDTPNDLARVSRYGCHKLLAEQLVRHYARRWLIVRLGGMVGPGLRKNPVYDILHGLPLRIHPDSQYQFMHTAAVARIVWQLIESGQVDEVFNVCGVGLISPREIGRLAGRQMDLSQVGAGDGARVVHANTDKLRRLAILPDTEATVAAFVTRPFGATE